MTCPHLDYRREAGDQSFDEDRAYCTVVGEFVQPMRADVCNDRYDLHHSEHCEIFREHESGDATGETAESGAGEDES